MTTDEVFDNLKLRLKPFTPMEHEYLHLHRRDISHAIFSEEYEDQEIQVTREEFYSVGKFECSDGVKRLLVIGKRKSDSFFTEGPTEFFLTIRLIIEMTT